eukprot:6951164-Prymnesium_polylepis.1
MPKVGQGLAIPSVAVPDALVDQCVHLLRADEALVEVGRKVAEPFLVLVFRVGVALGVGAAVRVVLVDDVPQQPNTPEGARLLPPLLEAAGE